jgi:hypothetical protein
MMFIVSSFVVFEIVWNSSMGPAQSSYMGAGATPVPPTTQLYRIANT